MCPTRSRHVSLALACFTLAAAACSGSSTKPGTDAATDSKIAGDTSLVMLDGAGPDVGTPDKTPRPALLRVTPTSIELGMVQPGMASPPQAITVTATDSVTELTVSLSSDNLTLRSTTCGKTLAAGASCVVTVVFAAATLGVKQDSVLITADGQLTPVTVSATVTSGRTLVVVPSGAQSFSASVGSSSTPITFGVANPADMTVGPVVVTVSGPDAVDFAITANDCDVLAPLDSCTLVVVFTPKVIGARNATLVVTVAQPGVGGVSIPLVGNSLSGPGLGVVTPARGDLGSVAVGTTGLSTTYTFTNTSAAAVTVSTVLLSSTEFVLTADLCSGMTIAARGGTCTVAVALHPVSVGAKVATLTIDSPTAPPVVKTLTGTGIEPIDGGIDGGVDANQDAPLDTAIDQQPGEAGSPGLDGGAG